MSEKDRPESANTEEPHHTDNNDDPPRILCWEQPDEVTEYYDILHWTDKRGRIWRLHAPGGKDYRSDTPPVSRRIWLHGTERFSWLVSRWPEDRPRDLECDGHIFNVHGIEYFALQFRPTAETFWQKDAAYLVEQYTGKKLIHENSMPHSILYWDRLGQARQQGTLWPAYRDSRTQYWLAEDVYLFVRPCVVCGQTSIHAQCTEWRAVVCSDECRQQALHWEILKRASSPKPRKKKTKKT